MSGVFLAIAYTALLLYGMRRLPFFSEVPGLPMRMVAGLFLLKIAAGTVLWSVYTYLYPDRATADIFKFFDDSAVLHGALWTDPADYLRMLTGIDNGSSYFTERYYSVMNNWVRQYENNLYNDSHTMIRFNAVLRLFSFGQYHVHTVFASAISLTGLIALYRAFIRVGQEHSTLLIAGIFFWPSVLFWPSGVLKECLLMGGFGIFTLAGFKGIHQGLSSRTLAFGLLGFALLLLVKYYVLLCLVPPMLAYGWQVRTGGDPWRKTGVVLGITICAALLVSLGGPAWSIMYHLTVKQYDFIGLAYTMASGSYVDMPLLHPDVGTFIRNIPSALYITFIAPFQTWDRGALGLLGALENLLIPFGALIAWRYRRPWSAVDLPLLVYCVTFILLLALIIGWTVPIMGALVRYRVPILPMLAVAFLLILDPQRLPQRIRSTFM